MSTFDEGDEAYLRVKIHRINSEQALVEFTSMHGPYSVRVPVDRLTSEAVLLERVDQDVQQTLREVTEAYTDMIKQHSEVVREQVMKAEEVVRNLVEKHKAAAVQLRDETFD